MVNFSNYGVISNAKILVWELAELTNAGVLGRSPRVFKRKKLFLSPYRRFFANKLSAILSLLLYKKFQPIVKAFEKCSNLDQSKFNMSILYYRKGQFSKCLRQLGSIASYSPMSQLSYLLQARIFLIRNDSQSSFRFGCHLTRRSEECTYPLQIGFWKKTYQIQSDWVLR